MFQRRYADNRRGGGVTPIPTGIVSNPVLDPALEGQNLSLTPAVVTSPPPAPTSTYTLYINSAPVVGYVGVDLATLQSYVWQPADGWLDAYVDETITSPWILGSPVTVSSNTVNIDALSFNLLIQTNASATGGTTPQTGTNQFRFYANAGTTYDIDWGDGTIQFGLTGTQTRTYASIGTYTVRVKNWTGATVAFSPPISGNSDCVKILELQAWGSAVWTTTTYMFIRARRMIGTFSDAPNLSSVTDASGMFITCHAFNGSPFGSMDIWDVSNITNMAAMFNLCYVFNQPIGSWDVSNVTTMSDMFNANSAFNQDISGWDVSSVTDFSYMFRAATVSQAFNQDIGGWNTSSATNMAYMFEIAGGGLSHPFNQDISGWDVSNVTNMTQMFNVSTTSGTSHAFDQDLGSWTLNNSVLMNNMFNRCGMSTENYSRTLIGWANEWSASGDPINRTLGATNMTYHNTVYGGAPYDNAVSARAALVGATPGGAGWTITGDSLVP